MEDRLPDAVAVEILAEALRDTAASGPVGQAKYEFRRYASVIVLALERSSVELVARSKVVPLKTGGLRSSRIVREVARAAWSKRLEETGDAVAAFEVAVRVTLARQPSWTLRDACVHTLKFVVVPE